MTYYPSSAIFTLIFRDLPSNNLLIRDNSWVRKNYFLNNVIEQLGPGSNVTYYPTSAIFTSDIHITILPGQGEKNRQ